MRPAYKRSVAYQENLLGAVDACQRTIIAQARNHPPVHGDGSPGNYFVVFATFIALGVLTTFVVALA